MISKVKITFPTKSLFKTQITLRITDLNYGGHLGNDSVLTLCHEARARLFRAAGVSEQDVGGAGIIMVDAMVMYLAEGFAADVLEATLYMDDWRKFGFDLYYLFERPEDGKTIAKAKTGIAFFDYQTKKLARTPNDFKKTLEQIESNNFL